MPVTCFLILRPKADPMTSTLTLPRGFLMKWPRTLPAFFLQNHPSFKIQFRQIGQARACSWHEHSDNTKVLVLLTSRRLGLGLCPPGTWGTCLR